MKKIGKMMALLLAILLCCGCSWHSEIPPTEPTQSTIAQTLPSQPTELPQPTEPIGPTVLDFLKIATMPVGNTMYIWGGGWNEADTGAGEDAVTLGISPQWAIFAADKEAKYDHNDFRYQIHNGLDCSGYVGWAVYNLLETENGREGYVCKSTQMAQALADRGLGLYIPAQQMTQWQPGDIMSMPGHVWIVVGMCDDGSVLLLHSSPPGVMFSGTLLPNGGESQASRLAQWVMQTHFPQWYEKFPQVSRSCDYLSKSSAMRWTVLEDPEGIRNMTAQQIVEQIFS